MRRTLIVLLLMSGAAWAGPAERACNAVSRSPGPAVCACAQQMADVTLSARDQKVAASIIREPDLFQKYRNRKGRRAEAFIERYRLWGERVETHCSQASRAGS